MEHPISEHVCKFNLIKIEQNFEWPIAHRTLVGIQYDMLQEIIPVIRSSISQSTCYDIGVVIFLSYSMEIIRIIQSTHIAEKLIRNPETETITRHYQIAKSFALNSKDVKMSGVVEQLVRGYTKSYIKKYGRKIKYFFKLKNSLIRWKCRNINNRDLTFLLDDMSHVYANNFNKQLIYFPLDELFFRPGNGAIEVLHYPSSLRNELYSIAMKYLDMHACKQYLEPAKMYMAKWLNTAWDYTHFYLVNLEDSFKKLPKSVCVGSGAGIWYRLIARFMMKNGVEVVRFDHGSSSAFYETAQEQAHFEFEDCSKFYTFVDKHAFLYQRAYKGDLSIQNKMPQIGPIGQNNIFQNRHNIGIDSAPTTLEGTHHTRTVLFIMDLFPGEKYYMSCPQKLCDISILHFTQTVYDYVTSLGVKVTLKPHPSIQNQPYIYEYLRAFCPDEMINLDIFESTYYKYDTILFSSPRTTLFSTIMTSRKKIIYFDIGGANFLEGVKELFEKSCHIVRGKVQQNGLVEIDRVSLKLGLKSPIKQNSAFQKQYLVA